MDQGLGPARVDLVKRNARSMYVFLGRLAVLWEPAMSPALRQCSFRLEELQRPEMAN